MTKKDLRIVFMGTPDFAAGILDYLISNEYNIVGVITAADKPAGRGQKIRYSAVKTIALEHGLPLLQPTNLKHEAFLAELRSLNADLQIVVAFRMLPEAVWKMPRLGTFNLHASLLPQYRGAAPINWAIINGETETGVTTFFIDDKIDTGSVIHRLSTHIGESENAGELHDRLLELGKQAVGETLQLILDGRAEPVVQADSADLKTAYKLNRDNCRIHWDTDGRTVYNLIRGLSPYPAAYTMISDRDQMWDVKIYDSEFEQEPHSLNAGTIVCGKSTLKIAVPDGFIIPKMLQFPGKKAMPARDLLNGMTFSDDAKAL